MGKAKRAQQKRAEEKERAERVLNEKRAERRETIKITVAVVAVLLVVAIVAASCSLIVLAVRGTGNYLRNKIGLKSEHYEVNNAMMSYFFHDTVNTTLTNMMSTYVNAYGIDASAAVQYGLIPDPNQPLKNQTQSNSSTTWYDYFMSETRTNVTSMLVLAEGAHEAGITLDEDELKRIDESIESLEKTAEANDTTADKYLSDNYGYGVKESDVRDALELYYLSQKYYYITRDSIEVTDVEINEYYNTHSDDYDVVDYKSYTFDEESTTDALDKAAQLSKATTPEEFDSILKDIIKDDYDDEETLGNAVEATLHEDVTVTDDDAGEWLFSDERKVNDIKAFSDATEGTASVYMILNTVHRDEEITRNVRHVLFDTSTFDTDEDAKKAADDALQKFIDSGKSLDTFESLAHEFSTDSGSFESGGLYMNVRQGQMVTEFDEWLFDDARKEGDADVVKTDYGYHVMYYAGEGLPTWKALIRESVLSEKYSDIAEDMTEKYTVTFDEKTLNKVPDIA